MPILVAGRFVQGLGTGAVPPVAYAAIGRAFADRARARMFALMSTAWVLPGVVGPAIAGTVAEQVGWRWVFLAIVPLVFATGCLALPTLLALGRPAADHPATAARRRIGNAIALAAGVGLVVAGLSWLSPLAIPVVVLGIAVAAVPLKRLLPHGTLTLRRGLPAAVAARGLQTFAFFGAEAYVPLALNDLRGQRAAVAGLVLTGSTITWTAGAWIQERTSGHVANRRRLVGRGFVVLTTGVVLGATVLIDAVPVFAAAAGWALAGLGMGMSYSGLSLIVLAEAPPGREGEATSALQLSDVLGMALGTGLGGAAVALGNAAGWSPRPGVAVAFFLAATAGVLACVASHRLPVGRETRHEDPLAIHGSVGDPGIGADRRPIG
jgi:MFS family permease